MILHPFDVSLLAALLVCHLSTSHSCDVQSGGQMTQTRRSQSPVTSFCKEKSSLSFKYTVSSFPSPSFTYNRITFNTKCEKDIMREGRV